MPDIIWEEPPMPPVGLTRNKAVSRLLRARKGHWARVSEHVSMHSARQSAHYIAIGRSSAYTPAGDFEATPREVDGRFYVYARYLGDGPDE